MLLFTGGIKKTQVLSNNEAADYVVLVYEHKDLWKTTELGTTLGLAFYKQIESGWLHSYHLHAATYNSMLGSIFPNLERQLIDGFTKVLPPTWVYPFVSRAESLGVGWSKYGITIELEGLAEAYIHLDYEGICAHPEYLSDPTTIAFSCVLPLALPEVPAGLYLFSDRKLPTVSDDEYTRITQRDVKDATLIEYNVGEMVVFDSYLPHAIQPFSQGPRICVVIHFMLIKKPVFHWEFWF